MTDEITYTQDEFKALPPTKRHEVLAGKPVLKGTVVIRRADGSIKYDDDSLKGTYNEDLEDGIST